MSHDIAGGSRGVGAKRGAGGMKGVVGMTVSGGYRVVGSSGCADLDSKKGDGSARYEMSGG